MTAFTFIFISVLEYIGIFVAMLALFRYPVAQYAPQIAFTSLICSGLSYALSVENDVALAPIIQLILQAICVWLMFNTPLVWSVIICGSFFVVYALFQGGVIYALFVIGLTPAVVPKTSVTMYMIQIFCSGFCFALGSYWLRKRIGFLFVPTSRDERFVWSKTGKWLFIGSVIAFVALGTVIVIHLHTLFKWFYVLLFILLVLSGNLLYMMKRKNKEYVEKPRDR